MPPPNSSPPPTTLGELLAHLHYIRERVDETHVDMRTVRDASATHRAEIDAVKHRIADLEDRHTQLAAQQPTRTGGTIGGVIGGLVSGFLSGWLGK